MIKTVNIGSMNKLKRIIKQNINGSKVLFFFIAANLVYVFMLFITIPRVMSFANGIKLLDMMPTGYNAEYINTLFNILGENGREAYLLIQIPVDMIYPLLFGIAYCLLMGYLLNKLNKFKTPLFYLCLLPLTGSFFDYMENIGIITMLTNYPDYSSRIASITNFFTILKSGFTTVYFIALTIIFIMLGVNFLTKRKIVQNS